MDPCCRRSRPAQDNRRSFQGMMRIARTGAQWRSTAQAPAGGSRVLAPCPRPSSAVSLNRPADLALDVEFTSGRVYRYSGVPEEVALAMRRASPRAASSTAASARPIRTPACPNGPRPQHPALPRSCSSDSAPAPAQLWNDFHCQDSDLSAAALRCRPNRRGSQT